MESTETFPRKKRLNLSRDDEVRLKELNDNLASLNDQAVRAISIVHVAALSNDFHLCYERKLEKKNLRKKIPREKKIFET